MWKLAVHAAALIGSLAYAAEPALAAFG